MYGVMRFAIELRNMRELLVRS